MRLPWSKKRDPHTSPEEPRPDPEQAERELERSRRELEATHAATDYYRTLGRDLRKIRMENHLAESFLAAAQGRRHG